MSQERKFRPVIKLERCKACGVCIEFCPLKVFESDAMEKPVVKIDEECIGCQMCRWRCPGLAVTIAEVS